MITYLEKALNVRRHEFVPAFLLFLYLFLVIAFYIMGQSVGDALFLNAFPNHLPHAIIGTALLSGLFVWVYIRLSHRVRLEQLIIGSMLFFSLSFVLFWWLTRLPGNFVYPLIYLWVYTAAVVGTATGWTLANYVLTTREARRVFGFIGAGAILGGIFGGFFTNAATQYVRSETLLLAMAVSLGMCAPLVKLLFWRTRQRRAELNLTPSAGGQAPKNLLESLALLRGSRYLLLITALIVIGSVTTTIIGYQFKVIAKAHYGADKASLTAFFGSFYGYMGIASFLLQLMLTGRLLRSLGIRVTLLILPFVYLAGSMLVLLVPTLVSVVVLRGSHNLLRYSLDRSSTELLYLPMAPDIKSQIKSFLDIFMYRVADGAAGLVLWVFANLLHFTPGRISLVNFVFLGGWIAIAYGVRQEYLNVLRRAIQRHALDPERTATGILDATTTGVLALALEQGDEQQILYGLSLFEVGGQPGHHPMLRDLLKHPSPAVRQRALHLLSDTGDLEILPQAEVMLADQSIEVRTEAMHYLATHTGRDPLKLLGKDTELPDYSLQGSVAAYLARTEDPENLQAAQIIFQNMLHGTGPEAARARSEAARVLGTIPPPSSLHSELLNLLRDDDPEVLGHALLSAGNIQRRDFLPLVIEKLGQRRVVPAARAALVQYGERAVGTLQDYLNNEEVPLPVRKQIPGVLAGIPSPQSVAVLADSLIQGEPGLRYDVLKAMNKLRRSDPALLLPNAQLENMLRAELMGYYRSFQILAAVNPRSSTAAHAPSGESLLTRALRERMDHELERIFRLLALLYPPRDIHNAFAGLTSPRPQLQANALEVLENLLRNDLYRPLAYVLDPEMTLQQKLGFAHRLVHTSVNSHAEALRVLLHSEDRWLRACALHAVGEARLAELSADLPHVPRAGDALLEETWAWTNARLAPAATG